MLILILVVPCKIASAIASEPWTIDRLQGMIEMCRISVFIVSTVTVFNWFNRENCALTMGFLSFHQLAAYFSCYFVNHHDDLLKVLSACFLPLVVVAMYKWFSIDPVDEGIIMNE